MDVFMYQAALLCYDCGIKAREALTAAGEAPEAPDDEGAYDSDDFPKGPYPDGGGKADSPQHCDCGAECINAEELPDGSKVGAFLENDLTDEGRTYVEEACKEALDKGRNDAVSLNVWADFYQISLEPDDEGKDNEEPPF